MTNTTLTALDLITFFIDSCHIHHYKECSLLSEVFIVPFLFLFFFFPLPFSPCFLFSFLDNHPIPSIIFLLNRLLNHHSFLTKQNNK